MQSHTYRTDHERECFFRNPAEVLEQITMRNRNGTITEKLFKSEEKVKM